MILDRLEHPIVLAPLAGGPSTPQLAAAVSNAGGLGFLGAGYLSAEATSERLAEARGLTSGPLGVNLFVPSATATAPEGYAGYLERLRRWAGEQGLELGEARFSEDEYEAKLELLHRAVPDAVSFTFGCPSPAVIESWRKAGVEVWVNVTSPEEAREAARAGAGVLVVQGSEAGGHRASFVDRLDLPLYGLLPLIALVRESVGLPLVASGGIATGAGVAAVICAGAAAAQLGTAFLLAPEAGTSAAHRRVLAKPGSTVLTRAFTGRLARGIHNRFIAEHDANAPVAYPELHYVTAPLRGRAREQGDPDLINLWAGEAHQLAREVPASEIVAQLVAEAREAMRAGSGRLRV